MIHVAFQCLCTNNGPIWHIFAHIIIISIFIMSDVKWTSTTYYYMHAPVYTNVSPMCEWLCTGCEKCNWEVWLLHPGVLGLGLDVSNTIALHYFAQLVQVCTQFKSTSWLSANVHVYRRHGDVHSYIEQVTYVGFRATHDQHMLSIIPTHLNISCIPQSVTFISLYTCGIISETSVF